MGISSHVSSVMQSKKLKISATAFIFWMQIVELICRNADNFSWNFIGGLTWCIQVSKILNALEFIRLMPGVSQNWLLHSVALALISMYLSFSLLCQTLLRNELYMKSFIYDALWWEMKNFWSFSATLVRKLEPGSRGNEQFSVCLRQDLDVVY